MWTFQAESRKKARKLVSERLMGSSPFRLRQSARTEKASKHKAFSMNALCLTFLRKIFRFSKLPFSVFALALEQLFRQSEEVERPLF